MTITPADLAVGQVWRSKICGGDRHILGLDPLRYTLDGDEQFGVDIEGLLQLLNDEQCRLVEQTTTPVPHPAALADLYAACKAAERFIVNGVELGYIRLPDATTRDPAHDTLPTLRAALAKAGGA